MHARSTPQTFYALVVVLTLVVVPALRGGATEIEERQLKAAMIVSMLRYVGWQAPASPAAPMAVAVVGDAALAGALREAATGQTVDGRPLVIRELAAATQLTEPMPPVVVLSASQRSAARAVARTLEHKRVLTIGDGEDMGRAGLVIGVYVDGDRVRFDANTGAASRAGLTLSSRLLRLARIVG